MIELCTHLPAEILPSSTDIAPFILIHRMACKMDPSKVVGASLKLQVDRPFLEDFNEQDFVKSLKKLDTAVDEDDTAKCK